MFPLRIHRKLCLMSITRAPSDVEVRLIGRQPDGREAVPDGTARRSTRARRAAAAGIVGLTLLSSCSTSGGSENGEAAKAPTSATSPSTAGATGTTGPSGTTGRNDAGGGSTTTTAALGSTDPWNATPAEHRGKDGETFSYDCPARGQAATIWGTETYTDDSSVCTAGVHVGLITLSEGGSVEIEIEPGLERYPASIANGVVSVDYGPWGGSFVFPDARPGSGDLRTERRQLDRDREHPQARDRRPGRSELLAGRAARHRLWHRYVHRRLQCLQRGSPRRPDQRRNREDRSASRSSRDSQRTRRRRRTASPAPPGAPTTPRSCSPPISPIRKRPTRKLRRSRA